MLKSCGDDDHDVAAAAPNNNGNSKVNLILRDAGVEANEMDPVSLHALYSLIGNEQAQQQQEEEEEGKAAAAQIPPPPLQQVSSYSSRAAGGGAAVYQRLVSDLTDGGIGGFQQQQQQQATMMRPTGGGETGTNASTAGSSYDHRKYEDIVQTTTTKTKTEERMCRMIEEQTKLILDLHFRMDELHSALVTSIQNQHNQNQFQQGGGGGFAVPPPPAGQYQQQQQQPTIMAAPPRSAAAGPPLPPQQQPQPQAQQPQQQPHFIILPLLGSLFRFIGNIPHKIKNSRMGQIVRLFFELRRREVPDLNLGFIIKTLVMLAILMARMNHRYSSPTSSNKKDKDNNQNRMWNYRFYIFGLVVLIGFVFQSGYASFLYRFFIKEDYPNRIWYGNEDVDTILQRGGPNRRGPGGGGADRNRQQQQQQPRPPQQQQGGGGDQAAAAAAAAGAAPGAAAGEGDGDQQQQPQQQGRRLMQRFAVLTGQIPRQNPNVQRALPLPIRLVVESLLFVSSFFLSIFPMWTPQAAAIAQAQQAQMQQQQADEQQQQQQQQQPPAAAGNNNNNNNNNNRQDPQQIPQVRPPNDPAEYEEDELYD